MDITRENLKSVKEKIIKEFITEEELKRVKENLYEEAKKVINEFNNSDTGSESIDE